MNGSVSDVKEHAMEQKDFFERYARYDIVYVMLDKRIDHLSDEIKYVRSEIKDVRSEISKTNERMDSLFAQTNQKIDALAAQTNQKIDALAAQTNQKIDALAAQTNQKIDKLDSRIDTLCTEFMSMKRWGIGLFIGALATIAAIAVPTVISLLSG